MHAMTVRKLILYVIAIVGIALATIILTLKMSSYKTELQVDYSERYYQLIKKGTLTEEERDYIAREEARVRREAVAEYEKRKATQTGQ